MPIAIGDDLAVSFYVKDTATLSQHGASRAVSYLATGNHTGEAGGASFTSTGTSWWSLIGVDGRREDSPGTFVGFGDSITDGNDPPDTNNRWTDYFATRLQGLGVPIGVLNAGIGANQVTQDIGTITPRGKDATWTANGTYEPERVKLNDMLRIAVPGTFDQLADFDMALREPATPGAMQPQYDSGDGLHPNPLGLMRLAQEIPVDQLR